MIPIRVQEATLAGGGKSSVLGPFGCGFEEPLFYLEKRRLSNTVARKREHAKWTLNDSLKRCISAVEARMSILHEKTM